MKKTLLTLSMLLLIIIGSFNAQSQIKTTVLDEVHLLQNPFKPMNILLIPANIEGITARQGDLVMAFDGSTCVGAVIIEDVNGVLNLVATSSDEVNKGYKSGQTIRLEYHSTYDNTVYDLIPQKILLGSMNYEELGTLYAEFKANALGIDDNNATPIKVYPNPVTNYIFNIETQFNHLVQLNIMDISGRIVHKEKLIKKNNEITLDGISEGMYFIQLLDNGLIVHQQKIIVKK